MPSKRKYGDFTDPNNKYANMIPYSDLWLRRFSQSSVYLRYNQLVDLALFLRDKRGTTLLDASIDDIIAKFIKIDEKPVKLNTKKKYRDCYNSYFNFIQKYLKKKEDINFTNPVPDPELFTFTENELNLEDFTIQQSVLDMNKIKKIVEHIYYLHSSEQTYYALNLLIFTGARVSEICHIKLKQVNLEERWFFTIVKSKKTNKRIWPYFFPGFFVPELKNYIETYLKKKYKAPTYLFQYKDSFLTTKTLRKHLRKAKKQLGLKCAVNPHIFRDFLNTKRIEQGILPGIRELLIAQKPEGVNVNNYFKNFQRLRYARDLYDQTCPFKKPFLPKKNQIDSTKYPSL